MLIKFSYSGLDLFNETFWIYNEDEKERKRCREY